MIQKSFLHPSVLMFGLMFVFAVAVIGCGSGWLPSIPADHADHAQCSNMLSSDFAVSHKELSVLFSLAALGAILLGFCKQESSRLQQRRLRVPYLLRTLDSRNRALRSRYFLAQVFSLGILHPKIY